MLYVKNMVFLDGAMARLAPDLDLLAEIANISMLFAERHGEQLGRELGIDQTTLELNMDGVKAGFGVDASTEQLTYRELQSRRDADPEADARPRRSLASGDVILDANADRFSGFADLYDAVRPVPPDGLAEVITDTPVAVPTSSSTSVAGRDSSSRWAASWSDEVIGVEPSADMRARAAAVTSDAQRALRAGWSNATRACPMRCADVVLAVQALHWMEPASTFAEVARLLRPGGVFAAIDCDWPPSVGHARAEQAWHTARATIATHEHRLAGRSCGHLAASDLVVTAIRRAAATRARRAERGSHDHRRCSVLAQRRTPGQDDRQSTVRSLRRDRRARRGARRCRPLRAVVHKARATTRRCDVMASTTTPSASTSSPAEVHAALGIGAASILVHLPRPHRRARPVASR